MDKWQERLVELHEGRKISAGVFVNANTVITRVLAGEKYDDLKTSFVSVDDEGLPDGRPITSATFEFLDANLDSLIK